MSIYSKKQNWKLFLAIAGAAIVIVSLWYSNRLVQGIAKTERAKVTLWAQAIKRKANIVDYTKKLFKKIAEGERKKIEIWAQANRLINTSEKKNLTFLVQILTSNTTIPVMVVDNDGSVVATKNLNPDSVKNQKYLNEMLAKMKAEHNPIVINIWKSHTQRLYYSDSKILTGLRTVLNEQLESFFKEVVSTSSLPVIITDSSRKKVIAYSHIPAEKIENSASLHKLINQMRSQNKPIVVHLNKGANLIFYKEPFILKQLRYYPYIMFGIMALFLLIGYSLFSTARKSEQNQVWVGLAKETAHQLGTPLSSLMAWKDILETKGVDETTLNEIGKDVSRLEMITERFSKVGAQPKLEEKNIYEIAEQTVQYLRLRISNKVELNLLASDKNLKAMVSPTLLSWVLENLIKNAVDAIIANGKITVSISEQNQNVCIDVADNGKGLPRNKHKTIFEPGFTTKKRGWGLGLSLAKRIIENYHKGNIFVKESAPDKGTTFRIALKKS